MKTLVSLAWADLRFRPLLTALQLAVLALGVAGLVVLVQVEHQLSQRFAANLRGVDLVVSGKGSPLQILLSTLFHVDMPTGNIPMAEAERLTQHPMVKNAVPVALGDSLKGWRIVGTTPAYVDLFQASLAQGSLFAATGEVVMGAEAARANGLQLGSEFLGSHGLVAGGEVHDHLTYRVVGILAPTGLVIDRLLLTPISSVWAAHSHPHPDTSAPAGTAAAKPHDHDHEHDHQHDHAPAKGYTVTPNAPALAADKVLSESDIASEEVGTESKEITALLVQYKSPMAAFALPRFVNKQAGMQAAQPAFEVARLLRNLGLATDGLAAYGALLLAAAALGIFAALTSSLALRGYDLALLRALGARRRTLFALMLTQGLLLTALGVGLGVALGHGACALSHLWLGASHPLALTGWAWPVQEWAVVAGALAAGLLASVAPARRAYRLSVTDVMAKGGSL
jgi:putative ABC transport system permease protein